MNHYRLWCKTGSDNSNDGTLLIQKLQIVNSQLPNSKLLTTIMKTHYVRCSEYARRGLTVKDATKELTIRVRPNDIKGSICRDHERCAIAVAAKRQCRAEFVDIGANVVLILRQSTKTVTRYLLSSLGRVQVNYFDSHKAAFAPCDVLLIPPVGKCKLGVRHGQFARSGPSGKARIIPRAPTR